MNLNMNLKDKINFIKEKWHHIRCHTLGWHSPGDPLSFDGCSYVSICRYCNKKILQDSQGNWF